MKTFACPGSPKSCMWQLRAIFSGSLPGGVVSWGGALLSVGVQFRGAVRGTCHGHASGYMWGFRIKVLAFNGAADWPSGILKPWLMFVRWGYKGPERGRDLPIVTHYVRVTAIRSQLPHLSKREIDTLVLPGRVPGTEMGGGWRSAEDPRRHLCPLTPSILVSGILLSVCCS